MIELRDTERKVVFAMKRVIRQAAGHARRQAGPYAGSRAAHVGDAAFEYFQAILLAGTYLAKLTSSLGISDSLTGILSSIIALGGTFRIASVYLFPKQPVKKKVMVFEALNQLLAISLYALDSQPYNTRGGHARWNTASLRDWLSNEFYNAAFGDDEKQVIITKELENWKEQNTTGDPVTLITCDEAKQLFANHEDRMCTPTDYCVAQGARLSTKFRKDKDGYYNVNWWTRNHSWESNARGSYVANSGGVMTCGGNKDGTASNKKIAVRPAVYFDVQALSQMLDQAAAQ